jgi:hypothetical protein
LHAAAPTVLWFQYSHQFFRTPNVICETRLRHTSPVGWTPRCRRVGVVRVFAAPVLVLTVLLVAFVENHLGSAFFGGAISAASPCAKTFIPNPEGQPQPFT